jgi:hypothetical protein
MRIHPSESGEKRPGEKAGRLSLAVGESDSGLVCSGAMCGARAPARVSPRRKLLTTPRHSSTLDFSEPRHFQCFRHWRAGAPAPHTGISKRPTPIQSAQTPNPVTNCEPSKPHSPEHFARYHRPSPPRAADVRPPDAPGFPDSDRSAPAARFAVNRPESSRCRDVS